MIKSRNKVRFVSAMIFLTGGFNVIQRLAGKKVIGVKQTTKAIKNGEGKVLYIAKNADVEIIKGLESLCKEHSLSMVYVDTMKDLGKLCGIDVGAATALIYEEPLNSY
jgi:large subunit ribosomal protein L7A